MHLEIKGFSDGILITLPDKPWSDASKDILETVAEKESFFRGAYLFLNTGDSFVKVVDMMQLRDDLDQCDVHLRGIFSTVDKTIQNAKSLGFLTESLDGKRKVRKTEQPAELTSTAEKDEIAVIKPAEPKSKQRGAQSNISSACFVGRTVRSGVLIQRAENIVIIGDVNPGAEIVSEGSIIVWGKIKGNVKAGSAGNLKAFVSALEIDDANVSIGNITAVFQKDLNRKHDPKLPVTIRVAEGVLQTEIWKK